MLDYQTFYPYSIGEHTSSFPYCDTFNGQYIHSKLNTVSETCWHYIWPVSGTFTDMTCNTIEMFDVVLVTNQAWYNGGYMFANEGWTIMVT